MKKKHSESFLSYELSWFDFCLLILLYSAFSITFTKRVLTDILYMLSNHKELDYIEKPKEQM